MNTYVLIKISNELSWYQLLEEYDELVLQNAQKRFENNLANRYLLGDIVINQEQYFRYSENYIDALKENLLNGRKILINRAGGYFFLSDKHEIVKKVQFEHFPIDEYSQGEGLTGWLSPTGRFLTCERGEHHIFAQNYNKEDKELYIPFSSSNSVKGSSNVHINRETLTKEQLKWIKDHFNLLDEEQKVIVREARLFNI